MNHTPGPWTLANRRVIERTVRIREHLAIGVESGPTFAFLPNGANARQDIQEANAHLIAAAPDLLAALRQCFSELTELREQGRYDGLETIGKAEAAIAKAEEGGSR